MAGTFPRRTGTSIHVDRLMSFMLTMVFYALRNSGTILLKKSFIFGHPEDVCLFQTECCKLFEVI